MNHLQFETSPYLLQHAHNPVDWYAWKPEAFARARAEDRPILVSIGYSTCHWCHVMERESFEDAETAAYMNEHFINIKVDREERPDVDQVYMDACQAFSGQGGWPLNCFLLPDGRPFFAGTYYPPRPAHNRPSWRQLLENVVNAYRQKRELVEKQADQLTDMVRRSDAVFLRDVVAAPHEREVLFTAEGQHRIFDHLRQQFDTAYGGFGGAPKFPGAMSLEYLLAYSHVYDEAAARQHVERSLGHMIRGGIYDQLGGGFARYATDRAWLVPHFEKMLYDNALLTGLLAAAYQVTGRPLYRETIEETLGFIAREMTSPEGGFYSALDADSEGEEGRYYVWSREEVQAVLGGEADLFCRFYDVTEQGNWEGKNILWRPRPEDAFAAAEGIPEAELHRRLAQARHRLFEHRQQRVRPGLDDKIILGWNALQATAYARAGEALDREEYRRAATRNLDFLTGSLRRADGSYAHAFKEGVSRYDAFLDDYAFLIEALLAGYGASFALRYLDEAARLTELVLDRFADAAQGGPLYYTAAGQDDLPVRKKELYDSATPSGNSTMAHNLLRLAALLDRPDYRTRALDLMTPLREAVEKYPSSFARWAAAALQLVVPRYEIAVVGAGAGALARQLAAHYLPNTVLMASPAADDRYPLLAGKPAADPARIYVCRQYACRQPVSEVAEALKMVST